MTETLQAMREGDGAFMGIAEYDDVVLHLITKMHLLVREEVHLY